LFLGFVLFSCVACSDDKYTPKPCTALFCDDFEAYADGAAPEGNWQTRARAGTVTVDRTRHHTGSRSVRAATDAGSGTKTAFLQLGSPVLPLPQNSMFGRFYMYLESAPETSVHFTLVQATGTVPGQDYRAQYRYGGQLPVTDSTGFVGSQWLANYDTPDFYSNKGPGSDCWHHAKSRVVPTGKWACIEWQFDGPSSSLRLWQDGEAAEDLTVVETGDGCVNAPNQSPWTPPTFDVLELGFESYQNDDARVLYVDDVAVSDQKIGCQ
jgi:hypothetical protein